MSPSTTPDLAPDRAEIARRVAAVARQAADRGLDALVIVEPANVYYLSGFRTTLHTRFTAIAVRTADPDRATLVAPGVDRKLAREPVWFPSLLARTEIYYEGAPDGGQLANAPGPLLDAVVRDGDTVGVDLAGASYGRVQLLTARFPAMRLADATEILHDARRVKSAFELAALRRANAIAVDVLGGGSALLREGMTEVDLALALDGAARQAGADGFAFPTLVGFGPKSLAPHAPPTSRRLQRDRIVTIALARRSPATAPTSSAPSSTATRPPSRSRAVSGPWRSRRWRWPR